MNEQVMTSSHFSENFYELRTGWKSAFSFPPNEITPWPLWSNHFLALRPHLLRYPPFLITQMGAKGKEKIIFVGNFAIVSDIEIKKGARSYVVVCSFICENAKKRILSVRCVAPSSGEQQQQQRQRGIPHSQRSRYSTIHRASCPPTNMWTKQLIIFVCALTLGTSPFFVRRRHRFYFILSYTQCRSRRDFIFWSTSDLWRWHVALTSWHSRYLTFALVAVGTLCSREVRNYQVFGVGILGAGAPRPFFAISPILREILVWKNQAYLTKYFLVIKFIFFSLTQ